MDDHTKADLIELEKSLLTEGVRSSPDKIATLLHDSFQEISQSGLSYSKSEVLKSFQDKSSGNSHYEAFNFDVRLLHDSIAQVLFETVSIPRGDNRPRHALRSSIWVHADGRWQMIFHQGTIKAL